ncbi:MAG: hypothetical protein IKT00_02030 [Prevotella sp.]|nr:hypothetical protein [Prevotella sp.]
MILDPYIQKLIRERMACDLSRPSQFDALALDIEARTGERIGVNTLKRLFGLLPEVKPTESTFQTIARYLGYGSWRLLCKSAAGKNSEIDGDNGALYPPDLPANTRITVNYEPRRHVVLTTMSDGFCRVEEVSGGKLMVGDMLDVPMIVTSQPFIVRRLFRQGKDIGSYTGGIEGGITLIHLNS